MDVCPPFSMDIFELADPHPPAAKKADHGKAFVDGVRRRVSTPDAGGGAPLVSIVRDGGELHETPARTPAVFNYFFHMVSSRSEFEPRHTDATNEVSEGGAGKLLCLRGEAKAGMSCKAGMRRGRDRA